MMMKRNPFGRAPSGLRIRACADVSIRFAKKIVPRRFNSNISIAPVNTSTAQQTELNQDDFEEASLENQNAESLLHKYKALFPKDNVTNSQIDTFLNVPKEDLKQTIKIGVLYADEIIAKESRIIEAILADPLGGDNEAWFTPIVGRSRSENNKFEYTGVEELDTIRKNPSNTRFRTLSPILSSVYRPSYMKPSPESVCNDIELWEINDKTKIHENPKFCHFYINVTKDLTSTMHEYSKLLQNSVLLTVIDNTEYSPKSTESTPLSFKTSNDSIQHMVKLNSQLSYKGISQFLEYDTSVSTQFFESQINSNVYELGKSIGFFLQSDNLCDWLLKSIRFNASNYNIEPNSITETYTSIKTKDIPQFSESVHSELQNQLIPETNKYFKSKLRWWKLYLKNDNVEYDLKDFFAKNFMSTSIENYNYVRGKIVSKMQQHEHFEYKKNDTFKNPLLEMKNDLVQERLMTEIQPAVYSSITTAFVYYQLPLSVLSFLSYQYFEYSSNSAIALALLGWVVGFNHVSKQWEKFSNIWLRNLYEDVRLYSGKKCIDDGLLRELNSRYEEECNIAEKKNKILQAIKK